MPLISASDSVLIVVDAQPAFYALRADVDAQAIEAFLGVAAWVVATAATQDIPIIVTEERPEKNGTTAPEIAAALPPTSQTFEKASFGLAAQANIRGAIERTARRTMVLVGMETDVCVAHSAIGLVDEGFRVAAVVDAMFAPGDAHHHGIERLRHHRVELVSAKALFYEWLPTVDTVRAVKRTHPAVANPPFAL
jgi:nicotinamidase-related amidase